MKKLFFTLLCCSILLTACGTLTEESTTSISTESVEEADKVQDPTTDGHETEIKEDIELEGSADSSADSDNILGYTVQYADVMNGTGTDTIGQRAYIDISKDDLKSMSEEQYSELCTYVESLDANWFSVICDDGTGLIFTGCSAIIVTYGELDEAGCVETSIGDIIKSGDSFTYTGAQSSVEEEQLVSETAEDDSTQTTDSIQPDSLETASEDISTANNVTDTQPADTQQANSSVGGGNGGNFNTYDNPEQQNTTDMYVLNTNTMKIHHPSCSSVAKIAPHNYATSNQSVSELISQGYTTCGRCF